MNFLKKIIKAIKFRIRNYFLGCFAIFNYFNNRVVADEPTIGAFYQCYRQPKSVIATLASFRRMYPTSSIYLFCDNGEDFNQVALHFHCKYKYISNRLGNGVTTYFTSKEKLISWLKRLLFVAKNSKEDFLIILEDDVRVYKKIKKLKFDLNCIKTNHTIGEGATLFLKNRNSFIPKYINTIYYSGFGGSVISRKFLVSNFSDGEKLRNAIDQLCIFAQNRFNGGLPQDACLTMLVLYFGGTIGPYYGFTEVQYWTYKLRSMLGWINIVHNDKSLYNLPLSKDENRIFSALKFSGEFPIATRN